MNIFFLNTPGDYPNQFPPLGLLYLASICRKAGHAVFLYDLGAHNADHAECMAEIATSGAQLLCLSIYTTQITRAIALINEIKTAHSNLKVVVGGPHISALPTHTMKSCTAIDYEVFGEGELTLLELIDAIVKNSSFENIDGLCFRKGDGYIQNGARQRVTDLDTFPYPAVDLIVRFRYSYDKFAYGKKVGVTVSSRGCPYNCTFCNKAVFGNKYTRRSPENLIEELKEQKRILGIDEIYFVDDLFVTNEEWLNKFIDLYRKSGINLPWKCIGRVDQVNDDMYKDMRSAGCFLVQFGVETGDEAILKSIRKGIKFEMVHRALAACKKAGINTAAFFIIGHPGETAATALKTIERAQDFNADICHFFVLVPFPGTYNYQFLSDDLKEDWDRIRYYHKEQYPISLCAIDPETLFRIEKQARYEYYGRLRYFLANPCALRYPFKLSVIKAGASVVYFFIKLLLTLQGKRVIFKLRKQAANEAAVVH